MAEIGSVIDGKYEIIKQIGRGGMSTVYLALDRRLEKPWALKEIKKCGDDGEGEIVASSLLAEADIMRRLNHPALPRIVDIIEDSEYIRVVMDYIEGCSLDRILAERGPLPEELVVSWAKQICGALLYLHTRRPPIIYRDMKPANAMLGPDGNIRIIDFGIAREYKDRSGSDTTVLGTRGYASPEHYGSRQTDARSDIYTLGMTIHHLLTGVSPRTPGYVYRPVRFWRPELSKGIEIIIDKCTALDPASRYQSCSDLMGDLQHIGDLTADLAGKRRRRLNAFVVTAILAGFMFLAGFSLRTEGARAVLERYDALVSVSTSLSLEEKLKNYEEAVRLRPGDTTAYLRILDAIGQEGEFDRGRSDAFLSLYDANRNAFDWSSPETAELNYRIGTLYFNCYTGERGDSFSARVQKASPFFEANHDNADLPEDFEDREMSECYYQICSFYRSYVLGPVGGNEAAREDYLELIATMENCIDVILGEGTYDQLTFYSGVFLLLYDQREAMAAARVDEERVLKLLDRVRARTVVMNVQKEESAALQSEILDHYAEYRDAIVRAYTNT